MKIHLNECSMTGRVYSDNIIFAKECEYLVNNSFKHETIPERFMGPYVDEVLNYENSDPYHIISKPLPELILDSPVIDVSGEFQYDTFQNGMFDMNLIKLKVMNWTSSTPPMKQYDDVRVDSATYSVFNPDTVTNIVPIAVLNTSNLYVSNLDLKNARSISLFDYGNIPTDVLDVSTFYLSLTIGDAGHISLYGPGPLKNNGFIKKLDGSSWGRLIFENTMADGSINIDLFRGKHEVDLNITIPNNTKTVKLPMSSMNGYDKYINVYLTKSKSENSSRTDIYFDFGYMEPSDQPTDVVGLDFTIPANCCLHLPLKNKQFKNLNSLIVSGEGTFLYSDDNSITNYSGLFSEHKFDAHGDLTYIDFANVTSPSQCEGMFENSLVKNITIKNVRRSLLNEREEIIGIGGTIPDNYIIENIIEG